MKLTSASGSGTPTHIMADAQRKPSGAATAGWILVLVTCALSVIPVLGFAAWIIAFPMLLAAFILSIVAMAGGRVVSGLFLLLASAVGAPFFVAWAPFIATAMGIAATVAKSPPAQPADNTPSAAAQRPLLATATPQPTPRPIPTGLAAQNAQRRALIAFPDLGKKESPLNRAFLERLHRYQTEKPQIFDDPDWPGIIAAEAAQSLK